MGRLYRQSMTMKKAIKVYELKTIECVFCC
jgi:hypothetical protein